MSAAVTGDLYSSPPPDGSLNLVLACAVGKYIMPFRDQLGTGRSRVRGWLPRRRLPPLRSSSQVSPAPSDRVEDDLPPSGDTAGTYLLRSMG